MVYTIADYLVASGASASARGTYERQMKQLEGWLCRRIGDATAHDIERLKSKLRDMTSGPKYARLGRMFYKSADREDLRKLLVMKQRIRLLIFFFKLTATHQNLPFSPPPPSPD